MLMNLVTEPAESSVRSGKEMWERADGCKRHRRAGASSATAVRITSGSGTGAIWGDERCQTEPEGTLLYATSAPGSYSIRSGRISCFYAGNSDLRARTLPDEAWRDKFFSVVAFLRSQKSEGWFFKGRPCSADGLPPTPKHLPLVSTDQAGAAQI